MQGDSSGIDTHADDGADNEAGSEPVSPGFCTGLADHEHDRDSAVACPLTAACLLPTAGEGLQYRSDFATQQVAVG